MMTELELIVTKGLPGCGKTTRALAWVAEDPDNRARVGRDLLRVMLHGRRLGTGRQEDMVSLLQTGAVVSLLRARVSVVVDDTNLHQHSLDALLAAGRTMVGRAVRVWDMTDVPLDVCIAQDALREGAARVGEDVIRDMHRRWMEREEDARMRTR